MCTHTHTQCSVRGRRGTKRRRRLPRRRRRRERRRRRTGVRGGWRSRSKRARGRGGERRSRRRRRRRRGRGSKKVSLVFVFGYRVGGKGGEVCITRRVLTPSTHTYPSFGKKKKNNTRQHNNRAPRRFRRAGVGAHRPQPPQNPRLRLPAPGRLGRVSRLIMLCVSACKSVCVCVTIPSPLPKHHHHHRSNSSSTHSPPPPKKTHPPPPPNIITTTLTSPPPPQQQHGAPPPRAGQQLPRDLPPRPGREDLHQGLHARRTGPPVRILSVGSLCVCVSLVGVLCVLCVCACVRAAVRPWDFIRERESGGGPQPPNPPKPNTAPPKMTQVGRPCPGPQLRRCPPRLGLQPPSQGKVHVMIAVVCLLPILLPR